MRSVLHWMLFTLISTATFASTSTHLRLVDSLDRPMDGYCVDIHGTPRYLRTDLPLFAHNCKPRLTIDSAVKFDSRGFIRFVELDLCITIAGVNSQALPGAAVLLSECGEDTVFMETEALQTFHHRENNTLVLGNSGLCLAVGRESATTYSASDSWRPLFVEDCERVDPSQSRWNFTFPQP